ncbi:hypothetical protein P4V41_20825 [Fictibacillus nanhaiensis]|uniref:hypothetical protein n=1 Tax=Fictibacillus nanhaiensis TaxID=742169 RepID=UPI002E1ED12A|nr:hypothetical protein [Fictibacillus nanhaiensis]
MSPIKEGFRFYTKNVEYLLLLSITIVLPLLILHFYLMNYIYLTTSAIFNDTTFADLVNGFFTLLFLIVGQLPFIKFVQSDLEGEEKRVKSAYLSFLKHSFSLYLFGIVYCVLVLLGFTLFIIPGLILMVFLFLTPYISVLDDKPARKSWKSAMKLAKKNFFKLGGIIALVSIVEMIIGLIALYGVSLITNNFGAATVSQILLNVIMLPLLAIMVTFCVIKWRDHLPPANIVVKK